MTEEISAGMRDAADNTFRRWGMESAPIMTKREIATVLAISIGLGALFNEDIAAECAWMTVYREELGGNPRGAVLMGRSEEVLRLVNRARGL